MLQGYLGIDPGKNGGLAICSDSGQIHQEYLWRMPETERDIDDLFVKVRPWTRFAYIEKVSARPAYHETKETDEVTGKERVLLEVTQGIASTFKFGMAFGFLRGLLIAHKFEFDTVVPAVWQFKMHCMSGGDKRVTKARAQELFPFLKITHYTADAALISKFCWQKRNDGKAMAW